LVSLKERLKKIPRKLVPIKVGDVDCFVRVWSEREHIEWAVTCQTATDGDDVTDYFLRCKVIARSLAGADGSLVYENHEEVADLSSDLLDALFDEVCLIQARKDDAKKNSEAALPSNSV